MRQAIDASNNFTHLHMKDGDSFIRNSPLLNRPFKRSKLEYLAKIPFNIHWQSSMDPK